MEHQANTGTRHLQLSGRRARTLQFSRMSFGNYTQRAQRWSSSLSTPNEGAPLQAKVLSSLSNSSCRFSAHPRQKRDFPLHKISTFNPSEYSMKDILDLSGRTGKHVSFTGFPKATYQFAHKATSHRGDIQRFPFPPNSVGIFYFHDRTSVHPVAGEIRFRVLPMDSVKGDSPIDTASLFAQGHDLVHYSGLRPWRVSLLSIVSRRPKGLFDFMKAHGHITDAAETQVQSLKTALPSRVCGSTEQIVEQITDPFTLDLSKNLQSFIFLHKEGIVPCKFTTRQMIKKQTKTKGQIGTFTGARLLSLVLPAYFHD